MLKVFFGVLLALIVFSFPLGGLAFLAVGLVLFVKWFWAIVLLALLWIFRRPLGELLERAQGIPQPGDEP